MYSSSITSLSKETKLFLENTIFLTITGFLNRFLGFYYRIFLNKKIGSAGMGIYQQIFPLTALCHAFAIGGITVAISKLVSEYTRKEQDKYQRQLLSTGFFLSFLFSVFTGVILYHTSYFLAVNIYKEPQLYPLFQLLSLSFPFSALHACICGYYYGQKKMLLPSLSMLLEQLARIFSIMLIFRIFEACHKPTGIHIALIGSLIGEMASSLFMATCYFYGRKLPKYSFRLHTITKHIQRKFTLSKSILTLSIPVSSNRFVLSLLQSAEALLLPMALVSFGFNKSQALSLYGAFAAMALPVLLFPTTVINSMATVLLPSVSEQQALGNGAKLTQLMQKSLFLSFLFGCGLNFIFLCFGKWIGLFLFSDAVCGNYLQKIAFIAPFLCASTTLESILNGLGKMAGCFFSNLCSIFLRLVFVVFVMPKLGMNGYFIGLLTSQILLCLLHLRNLKKALLL